MEKINSRNKPPLIPLNGPIRHVVDTMLILIGSLVTALGFNLFLLPNHIASGGVSGVSVLVQYWFGTEPAYTQWALNIPLFVLGIIFLGKQYGIRSLLGSFVLPLLIFVTSEIPAPTTNALLASIYGGICVGVGLGLVFRGRGSTGGLTILAQIIQKISGLSFSISVVLLDGTVIVLAAFFLGMEQALYALIGLFVTGKAITAIEVGFRTTKVAYIISDQANEISEAILNDLDRGLTKLDAHGGYTGDARTVLMVVVGQNEVSRLKAIVQSVDRSAFVIISEAHEVLGEGFKREA